MARAKRTWMQRQKDLVIIADWYCKGYSQMQIAEKLSEVRDYELSQQTICDDLKHIRKRWMEDTIKDYDTRVQQEVERLNRVEQQAWQEWERSCEDFTSFEAIEDQATGQMRWERNKKTGKREKRSGDPKYLEVIRRCIEQRSKLLGLNQAERVDITWRKQAEAVGVDPDKVKELLVEQFLDAAKKGITPDE